MVSEIIAFIARHEMWAGPIMFLVSFGESFAFVSLAFPGTTIMIAAGAFIPDGTLNIWPLLIGGISGATIGDMVSYWLGWRYGAWMHRAWPFSRHPELLATGLAFFKRHGSKSVFIGRFFGPLRAVVPLVAGIAKMTPGRFCVANILSAFIWAPALLLPGALIAMAIDALHLAAEWRWPLLAGVAALVVGLAWAVNKYIFSRLPGL